MAQAVAKFTGGYDMRNSKAWNEIEEKNNRIRLTWFENHYEKIYAAIPKDHIPSKAQELIKELRENRVAAPVERFGMGTSPFPPIQKADLSLCLRTMKPVDPEVREILYEGISANGEGRELYLKERYKLDPNERYYFPEATSFDFGWNGTEIGALLNNGPRYGKSQIIKRSFFNRNGVHSDDPRFRLPYGPTITPDPL